MRAGGSGILLEFCWRQENIGGGRVLLEQIEEACWCEDKSRLCPNRVLRGGCGTSGK